MVNDEGARNNNGDDGALLSVNAEPVSVTVTASAKPIATDASSLLRSPLLPRKLDGNADAGAGAGDEYKLYPVRWFMLFLFTLVQFVNGLILMTFAPIFANAMLYYGVSSTLVNLLSISYMALYLPASFAAAHVLNKYGLKTAAIVGAVGNLLCGWIRYASSTKDEGPIANGYWLVLFGQLLGGFASPFTMNATTTFASNWFAASELNRATTVTMMGSIGGIALGQLLPGLIVNGGDDSTTGISKLLLIEAFLSSVSLPPMLWFRSNPPTPPSRLQDLRQTDASASVQTQAQTPAEFDAAIITAAAIGPDASKLPSVSTSTSGMRGILALLRNRNFMILNFIVMAGMSSLTALIAQIVQPCGYSSSEAGFWGSLSTVTGLVGASAVGLLMDATHAYNKILKAFVLGLTASTWFLFAVLPHSNTALLTFAFGVVGFFTISIWPVVVSCGMECSFPVDPELSTAFIMNFGNIPAVGITLGVGALLTDAKCSTFSNGGVVFLAIQSAMGLAAMFYNGGTLRLRAEQASLLPAGHTASDAA